MFKENLFHFTTFYFYCTFSLTHTLNTSHISGIAFHQTWKHHFFFKVLLLRLFSDIQLFPFISNSMQLLKELYFDLVNISAHLVLWASKVREPISKHPPGSSIFGSSTVLSISSVKQSYNVKMTLKTFYYRLQQPRTEMAIPGFICKTWWNVCYFEIQW